MLAWLILVVLALQPSYGHKPVTAPGVVSRIGYGVWFREVSRMRNSNAAWQHVFIVPKLRVPDLYWTGNFTVCPSGQSSSLILATAACKEYTEILLHHKEERYKIISRIQGWITQADGMLPDRSAEGNRKPRSPFNVVGTAASWLFGLATEQQILDLVNKVKFISGMVQGESTSTNRFKEQTLSVLNITNKRLDILKENQEHLNADLDRIIKNMEDWQTEIRRASSAIWTLAQFPLHIGRLIKLLSTDLVVLLELEEVAQQYLSGIQTLSQGSLPLSLVTPRVLASALTDTADRISRLHPGYGLRFPHTYHYYREPAVLTVTSGSDIYIQLTIPLDNMKSDLTIYKVYSTPMPLQQNSSGATRFLGVASYLAVDDSNLWYRELIHEDLERCTGTAYVNCPLTFALTHRKKHTCTSALYFKERLQVESLCKPTLYPYHKFTDYVHDLGNGQMIMSNSKGKMALNCPRAVAKLLPRCNLCISQVPCGCSVQSDTMYLPSSLQACGNMQGNSTVIRPVNILAIYRNMSNPHDYTKGRLEGAAIFNLSKLPFYRNSFSSDNGLSQEAAISLKSLKQQIASGAKEYIMSHSDYLDRHITSFPECLDAKLSIGAITVTFLLALCGIIFVIRLHHRYRGLLQLLSIVAVPSAGDAAPVLSGGTGDTLPRFDLIPHYWEVSVFGVFVFLAMVFAIYLFTKLLKYMARNSVLFSPFSAIVKSVFGGTTSHLCLQIDNETDRLVLPVKNLCVPPQRIELRSEVNIRSLRVESDCLQVRLCLDWGTTALIVHPTKVSLHLPAIINVPRVMVKRVMNMVHSPHICKVCIIRENIMYPIAVFLPSDE